MLSGLSFAHSLRLPSSSNSMIPRNRAIFLPPYTMLGGGGGPLSSSAMFPSHYHCTTMSRDRATVHRHCLHRCTRSDTDLPPVISVRATRASRPTCVYCEKRNTYIPYPSLSASPPPLPPPLLTSSLSLSLFLLLRVARVSNLSRLFTRIVYIHTTKHGGNKREINGRKQRV